MSRYERIDKWNGLLEGQSPTCMLDTLVLPGSLEGGDRAILRHLIEHWREEVRWVTEAREKLISESARVAQLGETMRKAGLRSYTDKEGRIYVAAEGGAP